MNFCLSIGFLPKKNDFYHSRGGGNALKKNYLPKDFLYEALIKRQKELETFISQEKEHLKNAKPGGLRITTNKSYPQYYLKTEKGDKNGKYIPKSKINIAKNIAQRDYEMCLLVIAEKQLLLVKEFITHYEKLNLENCYTTLSPQRKDLVSSCEFPNPEYIKTWKAVSYKGKGFDDSSPVLLTSSGLRVRSKSEIIIADALERFNIPFRYEFPVELHNYTVYPDFYCLNPKNGEPIIWEHFGLMDDLTYVNKALNKLSSYSQKGFSARNNLIITFENAQLPFSSKKAEEQIKLYFA